MTDYNVWNGSIPSGTSSTAGGTRSDSLVFKVTKGSLTGIAFYVPTGETNLTGSNYTATLYSTTTGLTGTTVATQAGSGTFTAGAWNWINFTPVTLTPGTWYSASVTSPDLIQYAHNYWGTGEPGAGGIVSGPITVPDQSGAPGNVQQGFNASGNFPASTNSPGSWYGVDVKVTVTSDSGTGSVKLPKMSITGSSTEKSTASGSVTLPKMSITGSSTEKSTASGSVTLPKMSITGSSTEKSTASGSVTLPKMSITGSSTEKLSASGVITLPKMSIAASSTEKSMVSGVITMPKMQISASGTEKPIASAVVTLSKMRLHGTDTRVISNSSMFIFSQL